MPAPVQIIVEVLRYGLAIAAIVAFIDCARQPAAAFGYINRLNKPLWLAILGLSAAFVFINPVGMLGLAGVVGMGVYFADVRPKIRELTSR